MQNLTSTLELAGRALLSLLFIVAGYNKIGGYDGTQAYMESMGVPGALLPLVILLELGGGLAILIGFQTRLVAIALAVFSVMSGVIFHGDLGDQMQSIMLMKNLGLAGGFLLLAVHGAGPLSVDQKRREP